MKRLVISEDIRSAHTLPGAFYREEAWFDRSREAIFAATWQYAADAAVIAEHGSYYPLTLLEGVLDEPLLLTRDGEGRAHCLSNVCTHRAKILVEQPGKGRMLTCGYHGRCFHLDGKLKSMPAFKEVRDFPSEADHLPEVPMTEWLSMCFVALEPRVDLREMIAPIEARVSWLPLDTLTFAPEESRDYHVTAHWALYCDNYLEGFHIPFVHPALNQAIDFGAYEYHLFPYCNLQVGIAKPGEPAFELPEGHPDHGRSIYAYYFWLFPNLMFNFYPWGLSLNVVEPLSSGRTRIRFRTYYFAGATHDRGRNALDETELEDEAVVESAQKGMRSRFYRHGRFSPTMEPNVHHFHRLVAGFMAQAEPG